MLCRIAFTQNGLVFMEWKKRSNAWLSMYLVRLGGEGSQHPLLQHWMKIRITRRIFKRAMSESHSNQIKLESLRGILWKQWSYVIACTESWCTQLTLEHHGFELHGSTDTQIFFFFNTYYSTKWSADGWIHRCGCRYTGPTIFLTVWRVTLLTPTWLKG